MEASDPSGGGYAAARAYKYYRQFVNSKLEYAVPESRISARSVYKAHCGAFDRLADFFSRHKLDVRRYIRFMAVDMRLKDADIDSKLMSRWGLGMFASELASEENMKKIYGWYSRSVKNVAEACLDSECASTADFIRKLARERKLASWVVAGKISAYYLAAIPDFREILPKLDRLSRDELAFIADRYDMYNTEVNKAVLEFERRKANPIRVTDEAVEKIRAKRAESGKNALFDSSLN